MRAFPLSAPVQPSRCIRHHTADQQPPRPARKCQIANDNQDRMIAGRESGYPRSLLAISVSALSIEACTEARRDECSGLQFKLSSAYLNLRHAGRIEVT